MKKVVLVSVMFIFALCACATSIEHLTVPVPDTGENWKLGYQNRVKFSNTNIREFIPGDESIDSWTKLITIQFIEKKPNEYDLDASMNSRRSDIEKLCKNVKWDVLEKSEQAILYEMQAGSCEGQADQYVLARMIKGNEGLHLASYAEKTNEIDPLIREQWIENLKRSEIIKNK